MSREQSVREIAALRDDLHRVDQNTEARIVATRAALGHPCAAHEFDIANLHEDLATSLRSLDRYDEAIEEMELAITAGYRSWPMPEVEIAELHLMAGRREIAASLFADVRARTPDDVWLYNAGGYIYAQVGDHESAIQWFADGIELAMTNGDPEGVIGQMDDGRNASLKALGRDIDELSERARLFVNAWSPPTAHRIPDYLGDPPEDPLPCEHCGWEPDEDKWERQQVAEIADLLDQLDEQDRREPGPGGTRTATALAWFPADQWSAARERWSELREIGLPADHHEYSRHMQGRLLALAKAGFTLLHVAPLTVAGLSEFAELHGQDPGFGDTRASYAAELLRLGGAITWPPGRNDSCWCGSGQKYKRCCLTAPIKED